MNLLFCCEFYFPSVGGVQEVMRQIAERLVQRGHQVTVVTTRLSNRNFSEHNGVKIVEFGVAGNLVRGMHGEIEEYRNFVKSFECDAILIKAAQQWTFDALFPVIDQISSRKVLIPCGFSGLYEPTYKKYFAELPAVLRKFDHLIFYASKYRDVDFARDNAIENFSILPNGASEVEFNINKDSGFRSRNGIPEDSFVMLTVGSMTGVKGHKELLAAFSRLKTKRHLTFIMNGNEPPKPMVSVDVDKEAGKELQESDLNRVKNRFEREGALGVFLAGCRRLKSYSERLPRYFSKIGFIFKSEGLYGLQAGFLHQMGLFFDKHNLSILVPASVRAATNPIQFWIDKIRQDNKNKLLIVCDFERAELVQAYKASDLFVFASNIEYSPLVLFESAAAGTPFLSVPVGNSEEIANWTGCGLICSAPKDERGYTRAEPKELARRIAELIKTPELLAEMGLRGKENWKVKYTWDAISRRYEDILRGTSSEPMEEPQ